MVTFIVFCGIGVVAVGLLIGDLIGRHSPAKGREVGNRIDSARSRALIANPPLQSMMSEYFPPPDDGRPQK